MGQAAEVDDIAVRGQRVRLTIPAKADYVGLSRLAIAALGARSDLEREAVADLKVAVSEACAAFIPVARRSSPPGEIEILFDVFTDRWVVTVTGEQVFAELGGVTETGDSLGLTIIGALVDEVESGPREGKWALTLVKHLP